MNFDSLRGRLACKYASHLAPDFVSDLVPAFRRLKCNLDCVSSSVINRCGVVAEQNVETVVRTAARYLKVLTETLKVPRAYASECGLLANVTDAL